MFGCDEGQLPHARSLEVSPQERAAGEGIEAERRLAYVAFTRAAARADAALDATERRAVS